MSILAVFEGLALVIGFSLILGVFGSVVNLLLAALEAVARPVEGRYWFLVAYRREVTKIFREKNPWTLAKWCCAIISTAWFIVVLGTEIGRFFTAPTMVERSFIGCAVLYFTCVPILMVITQLRVRKLALAKLPNRR